MIIKAAAKKSKNRLKDEAQFISVIIAAKNEGKKIGGLLDSFTQIDYPDDKYELILVDDNSEDDTMKVIESYRDKLKNLKTVGAQGKRMKFKRGALEIGIESASHPLIATTDADCLVRKGWLRHISSHFSNDVDAIIGLTAYFQKKKLINRIACFENLRSRILILSAAGYGLPYSAAGGNFSFSKSFLESIGGLSSLPDTIGGDDDLLLQKAVNLNLNIGIMEAPDSVVFTEAPESLKELIHQKARHTNTSFHYNFRHKQLLFFWHVLNLILLLSPLFFFLNPLFLVPILFKLLVDVVTVKVFEGKLDYKFGIFQIIGLQILYEFMIVVNIINSKLLDYKWKQ